MNLEGAIFADKGHMASFRGMKVANVVYVLGTQFQGGADFSDGNLLDLRMSGPADPAGEAVSLDLSRTHINRELRISEIQLQDLIAPLLRVNGPATFGGVAISNTLNLENASFQSLTFGKNIWPAKPDSFLLDGMTYENINPGAEVNEENWLDLLMLAEHSTFSPQVYRQLEEFLDKRGHSDLADRVYIAQKRRERREVLTWYSITWWWNLFMDLFIRYGRSPDLAFLYSLVVIAFGSIVFWKKDGMQPTSSNTPTPIKAPSHVPKALPRWVRTQMLADQNRSDASIDYNPVWYSLDLFISIVDLRMAEDWKPRPERQWARAYMRTHIILGWILIPIGLLALTGVIR